MAKAPRKTPVDLEEAYTLLQQALRKFPRAAASMERRDAGEQVQVTYPPRAV